MCQAAALVVSENLAGKPFPQNHHTSGSLKGEKKLEQDSSKVYLRVEIIWYFP